MRKRCTCGVVVDRQKDVTDYQLVKDLIKRLDPETGSMSAKGAGQGVKWTLRLHGRTGVVHVRNHDVNPLDALYVPSKAEPSTFHDFEDRLRPDAFWILVNSKFWD